MRLSDGSRVGIIGGGPAGSLFAYYLLEMAERVGLDLAVDIYEQRDLTQPGPKGCNMCGGVVSESMVQTLATDGIRFPASVVQRGLDSYVLHSPEGDVFMSLPLQEQRIAAMHRGGGPRKARYHDWESFDAHLLRLAEAHGATVLAEKVTGMALEGGYPTVTTPQSPGPTAKGDENGTAENSAREGPRRYDLLAGAFGVNAPTAKLFEGLGDWYEPPKTAKAYVAELYVGKEWADEVFGSVMHIFILHMPGLEFGALLPKGHYLTLVLVGTGVDDDLIARFLDDPAVRSVLPPDWSLEMRDCQCRPKLNLEGPPQPYADRIVLLGDSGITRLYKDGIGAAYRAAKSAAATAVLEDVSADSFSRGFMRTCEGIRTDNRYGRLVFWIADLMQAVGPTRRGMMNQVAEEQGRSTGARPMTGVLWDTFTGSAPYREVFWRTVRPGFVFGFLKNSGRGLFTRTLREAPPAPSARAATMPETPGDETEGS